MLKNGTLLFFTLLNILFLISSTFADFSQDLWDKVRFRNLSNGNYNISSGTGFFISQDHIITNYHVVENCMNYSARGAIIPTALELVAYDQANDLAVLKSPVLNEKYGKFKKDMANVKVGDAFYVMGYPLQRGESGIYDVVSVYITKYNYQDATKPIEFTISTIDHGNSGGPILDENANIAGIVQGKVTRYLNNRVVNREGIAIRPEVVWAFLEALNIPYYVSDPNLMHISTLPDAFAKNFVVNIQCIKNNSSTSDTINVEATNTQK